MEKEIDWMVKSGKESKVEIRGEDLKENKATKRGRGRSLIERERKAWDKNMPRDWEI